MTTAADRQRVDIDPTTDLGQGAYRSVASRIQDQALANPEAIAIRWMGRDYDYRQLWEWASFVAGQVGPGQRVAVCATRGPAAVAAVVGILSAGAVLVPIDDSLPLRRRQVMLIESGATKVIAVGRFDLEMPGGSSDVLMLDESEPPDTKTDSISRFLPESYGDDEAYIFFTSGTTGVPRGVLGIHRSLDHIIDWVVTTFEIQPGDHFAHARSLSFDAVLREILTPLVAGATLCIAPDPLVPDDALQWIASENITVLSVTPSHATVWLNAAASPTKTSLRLTLFSGEVLSDVVVAGWRTRLGPDGRIVNLYGPTETTMIRTFHEVEQSPAPGPQSVGTPISHSQILIVDEEDRLCGVDEPGEVLIRTSYGTRGYLNDPGRQRSAFVQNPFSNRPGDLVYRTGDRGWLRADGSLVVSGRFDDQVQILGLRIEPIEIKVHLEAHPGVAAASVLVDEGDGAVPSLTAYVVARQSPMAEGELRRYLSERIPGPAIPGRFVFLEEMPLTANGKVDRGRLATAARYRPSPSEETESRLAALSPEKRKLLELRLTKHLGSPGTDSPETESGLRAGPPLSSAQERLWFIDRLHPGRTTYNITRAFQLTGVLDVDHLRSALDSIQSRHEVLRTTYPSHDGIPYQAVSTGESVDFELIDISGDDADNHDDAVEQVIQREARKPFDLAKGPVWRVTLVALSPERHILIIVFHHIASDGWSMPIFYRELASHYHAGGRADLAPVPIQYSAYANRQRLRLGDGEFESDLRYWEKQLMGVPPLLELPSDRSRPPSPSAKGARYRFSLPGVTPSQVESLVRTTRVTPFMVGLSLFVGFLHRLSGAQDLVVGIPSADRPSTDVEDLIGFFVNSLAIRTVVDPKMSFRQLLEQVRETSIAAYNHRQVPFEHVVNRVNPVRNADRSPIFQVFFQSANNFDGRLELDDILVEPIPLVRTVTKFDLTLYLGLVQDEPSGNLVFATDLFDQETIVQLMDAFAIFVAGALGEPDREISALPFGSVQTRVPDQSTDVQMLLGRTATESRPLVPTADDGMVSRMVEIWSDLLGGSPIDADDDFFARGGHSLLAVRLLSRIENEWKVELPIGVLFDYSTPRLLSAQVESTRNPQRGIRRLGSTRAPLTFAQRRLWFLDQLSPGSANYHIPWRIGLEGELDLGALQVALDRLVVRHSVLRTRIVEIQGEPEQEVDPAYPVKIDFHDLSLVAPNSRDSQVSSLLTDQARLPFDLAHDQMMRVMLLKTGERKHILSVVTHHIASDAESMRILKKELKAAYDAEVREEAWIPDPLPFEYTDVAAWQQQRFSQQGEPGLAYWLETLSGDLPILDLRPDLPRPMTFTYSGGQAILTLENEVSETLLGTARRYSATPFMMLLAAFGVFLHRHTRQDDVIIGVAGTERVIPGTEGMIGFLVNTLPIRLRTGESHGNGRMATFVDYLVDTRQRVIEAMDHGQVPFEAIVEKVDPPRDPGRSPIYQVTFGLTDSSAGRFELAGLETMPAAVRQNERAVKFDLSLHCSVRSNGIRATFSYRTDLFRPATVRAFADQFGTLLKSIAESPDLPLDELNLVPNSEEELAGRDQVRQGPGRPPIGATPFSVFSAVASSRADAIAIEAADGTLTYKQLLADAVDLGSRLVALGVSSGEPVAILGHRSAAMVVAMLGVLAAGAAYVPIDPTYPDPRIQEMIEDAGITAVINCTADPANPEIVIKDADSTPYVGGDIAYLMYTSGSTGRAKAVKITQRGIVARFLSPTFIDVGPTDVMALVSSVSFDASTFEVFSALLNGASLVVVPPEVLLTPPKLAEFLHRRRVTIALFPTALFNAVIAEQPDAFASLHSLVVGGEAADAATMRRCLLNGPPRQLINAYGPTEATVLATYQVVTLSDTEQSTVPIGFPVSGTSVRIVDDRLHPVPAGMPGEILIGGEGLAAGYHGDPDLSDRTFVTIKGERFYRSGDLAMRRPAGDGGPGPIQFMGRLDRQLKIRGYRLEPAEIESRLLTHPQVLEAVVTPRHDHGEVRLTAYLVGSGDTNEIKAYLTERLPAFMVPASFVWLDAIPRTPQGKVDLSALPSPDLDRDDPVELADPDEQAMARIWESILHRSRVGRNDNFFDLGGHSLMAVKLFAAIEEAFGARPPLATVFEAPTVATLTKRLKQGFPTSTSSGELVEIRRGSGGPSLFLIHPAGGHVICYEGLARHLAPGQGVFGIQAVGVDGVKSPHRSIETMANHYVEVIKASQASGPYLIGGWSSGGLIAFEVARQLAAGGDEVGMLAMFDTNSPPSLRRSRRRRRWLNVAYIRRRVYMVARRYLGNVRHGLPWLYYRARARPVPTKRMTWHFNRLFRRMVTGYAPGFYDGTITYFRAKDGPGSLLYPTGWKTLSTAIEVIDTAGTHEGRTALVREPQAADLAEKLQHLINERYL